MGQHDLYTRRILDQIDSGRPVTQRSLSKDLGIALGLTNLLVRRIIRKGWAKAINLKSNHVRYLITPAGMAAKARVTRLYLETTLRLYTETRERIGEGLQRISADWRPTDSAGGGPTGEKRIVFYGAGEVAEIAYVSLQATDLRLIGVVDESPKSSLFFRLPVHTPEQLAPTHLNGHPFDLLVVTSLRKAKRIKAKLVARGFPAERICWL